MPPREKADLPSEPDPVQQSNEPAAGTVRLAVSYPHDTLRVGEGESALDITSAGTDVPVDREDEVRAVAKAYDVRIQKVS